MLNVYDVINYFFSLDPERIFFNQNLINRNGHSFYEGNARLNKYLHLSQNFYLAKTGRLLMDVEFYAYDNGAVIPSIQREYKQLLLNANNTDNGCNNIPEEEKIFLKKVFVAFKNADINEIIEIDHEDKAWLDKCDGKTLQSQKMETSAHFEEYRKQYADMLKVLDRMVV